VKPAKFGAVVALALLAGCNAAGGSSSDVGTVNVSRITSNWPKFLNYQNQLSADASAIDRSSASDAEKGRERADLQVRFVRFQKEVTDDVRSAAEQVANQRHLKLVVTREFVGYGGVDITSDIEKILKIDDKSTPAP